MTKAREIAELGQKLTVDGSGNLDIAGSGTFDGLTVEDATEALITLSDTSHSNQRMKLTHSSSSGAIEVGNNGAYGNFNIKAWNGTSSISRVNINSGGDVKFFRDDGSTIHTIFDASNGFTDHRGTIKISSNQNDPNDSTAGYITNKSGWGPTVHGYRFRVNAGATGSHTNVFAVGTSLGAVFNEDSQDYDFRVESDANTHMLFVDAGSSHVRIGTNSNLNNGSLHVRSNTAGQAITAQVQNDAYSSFQGFNSAGSATFYVTGGGDFFHKPSANGKNAVFNENGTDSDFRVESDSRTDMFFVDAANNKIGIKTTSPVKPLSLGSRTGANLSYIFGTSQTITESNGVFVSGSTSNTTDITYGLHLANNNSSTDAISPVIGFSALSNSDSYNHAYAYIAGFKSGQGADSNWNKGGIKFYTGAGTGPSERMRLGDRGDLILSPADNGHAVFNEGGGNSDFRVESDSNSNMLFVNAGTDSVVVNGTTGYGSASLTVWGDSSGVLSIVRNNISGGSSSGTTGLWVGDAGSGVVTLAREKTTNNTADTVIYGEHGYNVQDERIRASRGYINLRADGATRVQINSSGISSTTIYNNTSGAGANLGVASSGEIYRSTSSLRYKTDVQDAQHGLTEVLALRPVTYRGINDGDTVFGGLIAEEVHDAGLTEFVEYNEDGEPDALAYANMVSLCIKAIQELSDKNDALEARITALENA